MGLIFLNFLYNPSMILVGSFLKSLQRLEKKKEKMKSAKVQLKYVECNRADREMRIKHLRSRIESNRIESLIVCSKSNAIKY